jgi:hypothetical protein
MPRRSNTAPRPTKRCSSTRSPDASRGSTSHELPLGRFLRRATNSAVRHNLTENAIRPSAVGKKKWLFIGHPEAGWRSAVIDSVIGSCVRRGIDPREYLRDVLKRLPAMKHLELPTLTTLLETARHACPMNHLRHPSCHSSHPPSLSLSLTVSAKRKPNAVSAVAGCAGFQAAGPAA